MGVIPMGEHYKSIFLSVIILADKFPFVGMLLTLGLHKNSLVRSYSEHRILTPKNPETERKNGRDHLSHDRFYLSYGFVRLKATSLRRASRGVHPYADAPKAMNDKAARADHPCGRRFFAPEYRIAGSFPIDKRHESWYICGWIFAR